MIRLFRCEKGITLIEIIVSIAILGIIVTPISSLFLTTVKNNSLAEDRMVANQLAQRTMEEVLNDIENNMADSTEYEGKYKIETNVTEYENYRLKEKIGNRNISYEGIIDFSDAGMEYVENEDTLELYLDNSTLYLKDGDVILLQFGHSEPSINLKLKCDNGLALTIEVTNESNKSLNIYKVYSRENKDEVKIKTIEGEVYTYDNIFESSITSPNMNRVYKVIVKVTKDDKVLAELANLKRIE